MGVLSEGMVLTAELKDDEGRDRLALVTVPGPVEAGTKLA
jgi:hypothetical protein